MARTTSDLINDLDNAVTNEDLFCDISQTALIVGFEHEFRMIFQNEADKLKKLNTLVNNGGIPLGLIKATRVGNEVNFFTQPLIEFRDDPATADLLSRLSTILVKKAAFREKKEPAPKNAPFKEKRELISIA